ncbi:MAG: DUF1353 domain-containing protein [Planctomycetota bacterium]
MIRSLAVLCVLLGSVPAVAAEPVTAAESAASGFGHFVDPPTAADLSEPYESGGWEWRRLKREVVFVGPDGREWVAPAGAVVNGASIPTALRSWVGEPWDWEAGYVEASIVHDVYCTAPYDTTVASGDVHRMFYDACRARGVSRWRAGVMYAAVWTFGPRWEEAIAAVR